MKLTSFVVHGPYEVEFEKRPGGRALLFKQFWSAGASACHLANERGCYVFAMRNKALTPIYVGKATKTFKQETFNPSNKIKYQTGFSRYGKGTPVMYFVVHPKQAGRTNATRITEIENFLIQAGVAKNPELQNLKGTQQPKWSIKGVIRSKGMRNSTEREFSSLFDIPT